MISPDAKVIGHRAVRVGEPKRAPAMYPRSGIRWLSAGIDPDIGLFMAEDDERPVMSGESHEEFINTDWNPEAAE